jgi:hypothetical protein
MTTECTTTTFSFPPLGTRDVCARFDGGAVTSEGGALLLGEAERLTDALHQFAACFTDYRDVDAIEHTVLPRVSQRVYGLALGYQDLNDHDTLRLDPLLATRVGNTDPSGQDRLRCQDKGKPLAGKSTLKRLQLTPPDANADSRYHKIVADPQAISDSWSRTRRVVGKAEYVPRGPNPRLVVPSRSAEQQQARLLYEGTYGARGRWRTASKSSSGWGSRLARVRRGYAATSCVYGSVRWRMGWCRRCVAGVWRVRRWPRRSAVRSGRGC